MAIKVGIVGAPNKGKSTFFSALTRVKVNIADYPFTTIEPNTAIAWFPIECVCTSLGINCSSKNCQNGIRYIPIEVVDVAGLVKGAHLGRGMGNAFLDQLIKADGFIQVIDACGETDLDGKKTFDFPIVEEVGFLKEELSHWLAVIIKRAYPKFKLKNLVYAQKELSGLKISFEEINQAFLKLGLQKDRIELDEEKIFQLAKIIIENKPIVIAANKADKEGALKRIEEFKKNKPDSFEIIPCSAEYEYSLVLAAQKGLIDYRLGEKEFKIKQELSAQQKEALGRIALFLEKNQGTGVYKVLTKLIKEKMKQIVVYPVEDEKRYSDSNGNVLPDAFLVRDGTKLIEFAWMVHSDFATHFVGAIDAKTKKNLSKDYILKNNDVIRLISAKRK
ncbi:MAG: YchF-related putative GTPase [Candidatus Omnitrophica bacterium]|nr:YchF-related putative GTPase [Candidatus Omnitrophota bacterium]